MHVVVLINRIDPNNALQRLQSNPLSEGLVSLGVRATTVNLQDGTAATDLPSHLVFHYNDRAAIDGALALRRLSRFKIICLCSDVYSLEPYRNLSEVVDVFLAPSLFHQKLIQSAIKKPVFVIPEAVDPISLPSNGEYANVLSRNNVCWFGYPESFNKSLCYIINDAFDISEFNKDRFSIITSKNDILMEDVLHLEFNFNTFYEISGNYSYSILSHFPFDLKINTYIKSPNKMITSIVRGIIPLVSATPNYEEIARKYGLESLCFGSASDLSNMLSKLDYDRDQKKFGFDDIRSDLKLNHSPMSIARKFLEFVD